MNYLKPSSTTLQYLLSSMPSMKNILMTTKKCQSFKDCLIKIQMLFYRNSKTLLRKTFESTTILNLHSAVSYPNVYIAFNGTNAAVKFSELKQVSLRESKFRCSLRFHYIPDPSQLSQELYS